MTGQRAVVEGARQSIPASDVDAERAVLGSFLLHGDPRFISGILVHGLRPDHFYRDGHRNIFAAMVSLVDKQSKVDYITVKAEMERLGMPTDRSYLDELTGYAPGAGHYREYADIVIETARWRDRQAAIYRQQRAVDTRDDVEFERASIDLESATRGTRRESLTAADLGSVLFDHFSQPKEVAAARAFPTPFNRLTYALGNGLEPGEWCAISGPTSHGKSVFADQWLDHNADRGKRVHLYMTEMTALMRGMRMLSRRTGIPFMALRRGELSDRQMAKILDELQRLPYGVTIASDWPIEAIRNDALNARYDMVCVDLLHGFHYEDERGLDKLSKEMTKLARVSTTLDGFSGTAVLAVTHLKEEGMVKGKVPRPTISSIKGGSSIKQDADFVAFVWQEQEDGGRPTGDGEIWLAKGRNGDLTGVDVRMNQSRIRWEIRDQTSLI